MSKSCPILTDSSPNLPQVTRFQLSLLYLTFAWCRKASGLLGLCARPSYLLTPHRSARICGSFVPCFLYRHSLDTGWRQSGPGLPALPRGCRRPRSPRGCALHLNNPPRGQLQFPSRRTRSSKVRASSSGKQHHSTGFSAWVRFSLPGAWCSNVMVLQDQASQ